MEAEISTGHIAGNLKKIKDRIAEAALSAGRNPRDVKLVAVSKTHPPDSVMAAYEAGQRVFGENRVQELEGKVAILPDDIEWHLIGHLQGNKAVKVLKCASCIDAVDSEKLLQRLDRLALENSLSPEVLLEINVSGEDSKFGADDTDSAMRLGECALSCSNLSFRGLMTMAPFGASESGLREVFSGLRGIRERMQDEFGISLPELSMGMSQDFEAAILEGSTSVRVGSAIFGQRGY